ncbi:DUF159 domain protein [Malassezia restricta]|uniref:Uncharacterized protein n=1 Tax=Malassezia restricta (strain ATCC 96810 / NBRC 103918 / CBS 7877) TaxID=425264 RepID=A0A3G2S9E0_MALR7|nr:DUF159 domain protein [Malassezia restricta]AXA52277.1 DUF159 domain protein [Malassezia restricta]AYO44724.1 hypothetical protein DNF11_3774 [Malassezia restricta CBS 7877]
MCGRFACNLNKDELLTAVTDTIPANVGLGPSDSGTQFSPSYNIAPNMQCPVFRKNLDSMDVMMETMKWGVSSKSLFHADNEVMLINARDDTVLKPGSIWHDMMAERRCIVFCQGFYEWQKDDTVPGQTHAPKRIAHFVGMGKYGRGRRTIDGQSRQLMPMAAFWTQQKGSDQNAFAIVTTQANKQLEFLHDRMPVILPDTCAISEWLGITSYEHVSKLLTPYQGTLDCYKVPPEVGSVGTSNENYIYPLHARKDGILAMFEKAKLHTQRQKMAVEDNGTEEERKTLPSTPKKHVKPAQSPSSVMRAKTRESPRKRMKGTPSLETYWLKGESEG